VVPNTVTVTGSVSMLWLAPNEWLLVTRPDVQAELQTALWHAFGNLFAAVTDTSSGYTTIEMTGHEAPGLLARGCLLDLHPRVFAPGHCARTLLAKADVTIAKIDASPVFHVIVRRSLASYLWCWLDDAARHTGMGSPG